MKLKVDYTNGFAKLTEALVSNLYKDIGSNHKHIVQNLHNVTNCKSYIK